MSASIGRKPRVQGKIKNLPKVQRDKVHQYFRENLIYSEISRRMREEFGIRIAASSLCNYYNRHAIEFMLPAEPNEGGEIHLTLVLHLEIRPKIVSEKNV